MHTNVQNVFIFIEILHPKKKIKKKVLQYYVKLCYALQYTFYTINSNFGNISVYTVILITSIPVIDNHHSSSSL